MDVTQNLESRPQRPFYMPRCRSRTSIYKNTYNSTYKYTYKNTYRSRARKRSVVENPAGARKIKLPLPKPRFVAESTTIVTKKCEEDIQTYTLPPISTTPIDNQTLVLPSVSSILFLTPAPYLPPMSTLSKTDNHKSEHNDDNDDASTDYDATESDYDVNFGDHDSSSNEDEEDNTTPPLPPYTDQVITDLAYLISSVPAHLQHLVPIIPATVAELETWPPASLFRLHYQIRIAVYWLLNPIPEGDFDRRMPDMAKLLGAESKEKADGKSGNGDDDGDEGALAAELLGSLI